MRRSKLGMLGALVLAVGCGGEVDQGPAGASGAGGAGGEATGGSAGSAGGWSGAGAGGLAGQGGAAGAGVAGAAGTGGADPAECAALARLTLETLTVSDVDGRGFRAGERVAIAVELVNATDLDHLSYPGVAFSSDDTRLDLGDGVHQLYAVLAGTTVPVAWAGVLATDVPAGVPITVTARVVSLGATGCPDADRATVRLVTQ